MIKMGNRLYYVFISLLIFIAAYLFYALWHTEELNPKPQETKPVKTDEDLTDKELTPKKDFKLSPLHSTVSEDNQLKQTSQTSTQKRQTPAFQDMEEKTQKNYEELLPTRYEEITEEADIGFEELDDEVMQIEEQLKKEELEK
ncbi:MAG: hypothetical protein PHS85_06560 [Sulfurovum sp.]|nr:hypothetical protein [Sulfurovum sp.]